MTGNGMVSVIIPTYYRNEQLRRAIESTLSGTYEHIEIIVIDDSGESHARKVAKDYNVDYIAHKKNRGGNPARNTGIEVASGTYIQFLDDDDKLLPTKIERQVPLLASNPSVSVVYCGIREEDGTEVLPDKSAKGKVLSRALQFDLHPCQTTTMLFDAQFLRQLFPLKNRKAADDIGLKIRAAQQTHFDFVSKVLVEKGDSGRQRSGKIEFSDELLKIIDEFDNLYAEMDDDVRQNALAYGYRKHGHRLMQNSWWSPRAIRAYIIANYYSGFRDMTLIGALVLSIFGKPIYKLAYNLHQYT